MLVIWFTAFIRILTSFQRLCWGLVFLFLVLFGLSFWYLFFGRKKLKGNNNQFFLKTLGIPLVAFLLATLALTVKFWSYDSTLLKAFFSFQPKIDFSNHQAEEDYQSITDYFQVKEQSKPDRYVVRSQNNQEYLLKTTEDLSLGSAIYLGASRKSVSYRSTFSEVVFSSGGMHWSDFFDYQFSYDKWLMMKGYYGTLYPKFIIQDPLDAPSFSESRLTFLLRSWRVQIKKLISSSLPDQKAALLLGMMIGDRSLLSQESYQSFIDSGMVHIVAVSGGNIVMIVIFLSMLLFFLPFYLRNFFIMLGITLFALLCGGDSSVIRALIMALLSLFALFRGREIPIWRLMGIAFVVMLLYNPYFLNYDLGFLLSFSALLGIVLCTQLYDHLVSATSSSLPSKKTSPSFQLLKKRGKNYLIPTLGASLGTLPILIFFIGTTNLLGVFVNLLVVPLVPLITIGGFLGALLVHVTGWLWLLTPVVWLLDFFYWISDLANQYRFVIRIDAIRAKYVFFFLMLYFFWILYVWKKRSISSSLK